MPDVELLTREISTVVRDLEGFMHAKADTASELLSSAQRTAEDLLRDFQQEMLKREEELIKLRKENSNIKRELDEALQLKQTVASLNDKVEKLRVQLDSAIKERDKAKEELNKIQELWKRFTSGE